MYDKIGMLTMVKVNAVTMVMNRAKQMKVPWLPDIAHAKVRTMMLWMKRVLRSCFKFLWRSFRNVFKVIKQPMELINPIPGPMTSMRMFSDIVLL